MHRRFVISLALGSLATAAFARSPEPELSQLTVYKSPSCGCCSAWVDHLLSAGLSAETIDVDHYELQAVKVRMAIAPELSSCHTAILDGYFIEGHVPADDIKRLIAERPDALGLTVPGMPIGSPGMEMGEEREPFDTLLVLKDGSTEIFAQHA
jgi:hypothetical protein